MITAIHQTVMLEEAVEFLQVEKGKWYVDGTFGRGGHTDAILNLGGKVVAFDVDQDAIEYGQAEFPKEIADGSLLLIRENFDRLQSTILSLQAEGKIGDIHGVLFDFGTSADQLLDVNRGFSFLGDAELDMRMDDRLGVKAKDLLAILPEKQLAELFANEGGEKYAKPIAKAVVERRSQKAITTSNQLSEIVEKVKPRKGKLHPATKVFQALRIAVNTELSSIETALPQAFSILKSGRVVAISFHEGEDRLVKRYFVKLETEGKIKEHKLRQPSEMEIIRNPRSRSAKLRYAIT
jgi:16S rRNA (cytosine1402-N4)-methyltransferase